MTAPHIIDPGGLLGGALSQASPDLMRSLLHNVINAVVGRHRRGVRGPVGPARPWAPGPAQRVPPPAFGHQGRHHRRGNPQAALWHVLPRVAAPAQRTRRDGTGHGGGRLLPRWRVHAPHGQARQSTGDHRPVQIAGLAHGSRPEQARSASSATAPSVMPAPSRSSPPTP